MARRRSSSDIDVIHLARPRARRARVCRDAFDSIRFDSGSVRFGSVRSVGPTPRRSQSATGDGRRASARARRASESNARLARRARRASNAMPRARSSRVERATRSFKDDEPRGRREGSEANERGDETREGEKRRWSRRFQSASRAMVMVIALTCALETPRGARAGNAFARQTPVGDLGFLGVPGPPGRSGHKAVVTDDSQMFIFGGRAKSTNGDFLNDFWMYDWETGSWVAYTPNELLCDQCSTCQEHGSNVLRLDGIATL